MASVCDAAPVARNAGTPTLCTRRQTCSCPDAVTTMVISFFTKTCLRRGVAEFDAGPKAEIERRPSAPNGRIVHRRHSSQSQIGTVVHMETPVDRHAQEVLRPQSLQLCLYLPCHHSNSSVGLEQGRLGRREGAGVRRHGATRDGRAAHDMLLAGWALGLLQFCKPPRTAAVAVALL